MSIADTTRDYYHINRIVSWSSYGQINQGEEIDIGGSSNPYFRFFETQRKAYSVKTDDGSIVQVNGVKFLSAVSRGEVNSPNVAQIASDLASHLIAYLREIIWEDVRRKEFPHLPSRQRCIWLIPTLEGVKYWLQRTGAENFQVLKVRIQGRLHVASESFLLGDSEPMEETIKKARQYWLGIVEDPKTEEIIFEGRMRVVEVVAAEAYA